jgi:hypothetical protein
MSAFCISVARSDGMPLAVGRDTTGSAALGSAAYRWFRLRRDVATFRERFPDFATLPRAFFSLRELLRLATLPLALLARLERPAFGSRFARDAAWLDRDFFAAKASALIANMKRATNKILTSFRYIDRPRLQVFVIILPLCKTGMSLMQDYITQKSAIKQTLC